MNTPYNPDMTRQLSEWLVAIDKKGRFIKASLTFTSKIPVGCIHSTHIAQEKRDIIIHWYLHKPTPELEARMASIVDEWRKRIIW